MENRLSLKDFAHGKSLLIMAPAGCGKTHLIAESVQVAIGRQLILTHTHAGVKSILSKLKKLSVPPSKFTVETIAGFALKYATSYPKLGGRKLFDALEMVLYDNLYPAATKVLKTEIGRQIIQSSFNGLYVDEYQDCTRPQHELILKLSEYIPTHILGDPLQGIFDFTGDLVNWKDDISPHFELFSELNYPWRWHNTNPALGKWLFDVRELIENKQQISLARLPVNTRYFKKDRLSQIGQLRAAPGKCVGIIDISNRAHKMAQSMRGSFNSMEEVERKTLLELCTKFQNQSRKKQVLALLDVVCAVMTKVSSELKYIRDFLKKENSTFRSSKHVELYEAIDNYLKGGNVQYLNAILKYVEGISNKYIYRKELWADLKKLVKNYELNPSESLMSILYRITCQNSIIGRTEYNKSISRPFLIKGLEFEHAILLDADAFSREQLYVALTRGSKSLTILADSQVLNPR